jgi:DNA-binding response OmpR family regulator
MQTILLIDGDCDVTKNIANTLTDDGYIVHIAGCIKDARRLIAKSPPNAIVMERVLPDGSGLSFLSELKHFLRIPMIFYTDLSAVEEICKGLNAGANDYFLKPLDVNLFAVRLKTVINTYHEGSRELFLPPLKLHMLRQVAFAEDVDLLLTPKEFALLSVLTQNHGNTITRFELSDLIWGRKEDIGNTIEKNISILKKKLSEATDRVVIDTAYNGGYSLSIVRSHQ